MRFQLTFSILTTLVIVCNILGQAPPWCYEGPCGPSSSLWPALCNNGYMQSPINITTAKVTKAQLKAPLQFSKEFYKINDFDIYNNGRGIQIKPHVNPGTVPSNNIRVAGDGWNGTFGFYTMYFRWASNHLVNGKRYPLESTIVFLRQGGIEYGMVGVRYTLSNTRNKAVIPIISMIPQVSVGNGVVQKIPGGLNLSLFLPPVWDIYRYWGSLTIPPCTEGVLWNIFTQKLGITQAQVDAFTRVKDEHGKVLNKVYRPQQKTLTTSRKHIYWAKVDRTLMRELAF